MKHKDIYALAVRIVGLLGMMKIINHWARYWHQHHSLVGSHLMELFFEILLFLVGIFMVIGAPIIIRLTHTDDKD